MSLTSWSFSNLRHYVGPPYLKERLEALDAPLQKIQAFSAPDFTTTECTLVNSLKEAYGEAEMNNAFPTSMEDFESNRVVKAVTYLALENMLKSRDVMEAFEKYYITVASIKHSFPFFCKDETKELLKLIGKSDKAQRILNLFELCVQVDNVDYDSEIANHCGSEDKAKKVLAIKNAMRKKYKGIIQKCDIDSHYKGIIQCALNEVKLTDDDIRPDFSFNFTFYLIFRILEKWDPKDSFNLIFANQSITRKEHFREIPGLLALFERAAGFFLLSAKKSLSPDLKDREKILENLERKAIPLIEEKFSLFSKKSTINPDTTEDQIPNSTSTSPSFGDKIHNFLYFLPIWFLIIGIIIFLIVLRNRQKRGN
jgi:hypothetical protein